MPVRTVLSGDALPPAPPVPPIPPEHLVSPLVTRAVFDSGGRLPWRERWWVLRMRLRDEPLACAPLRQLYGDGAHLNLAMGWTVDD